MYLSKIPVVFDKKTITMAGPDNESFREEGIFVEAKPKVLRAVHKYVENHNIIQHGRMDPYQFK